MSYRVDWRPEAIDLIQREWLMLPSSVKRVVMDALDDVQRQLADNPLDVGESRSSDLTSVLAHAPILVGYRVDPRMRVVTVFASRLIALD